MKKKSINWKKDPLSWLSHTAYMIGVWLILGMVFTSTVGVTVACTIIYIREVSQNSWVFEPWLWTSWDSIFDAVIPIIAIGLLFNFLSLSLIWSLIL